MKIGDEEFNVEAIRKFLADPRLPFRADEASRLIDALLKEVTVLTTDRVQLTVKGRAAIPVIVTDHQLAEDD